MALVNPMKSILSREFKYVPAVNTDIRKTFARVRRELREKQEAQAGGVKVVTPLFRRRPSG